MKNLSFLSPFKSTGSLLVNELASKNQFVLKRFFIASGAENFSQARGHFHKHGQQLIVCISGTVAFKFWDGLSERRITLTPASAPILVSSPLWREYVFLSDGSMFLCLCDMLYEESKTSYSIDEFMSLIDE
jgi:hypothetical protein